MNLMEGLLKQMNRNREILKLYEDIPSGAFGAAMIRESILAAEKSITDGDVVAMLRACKDLENTK